MTRIRISLGVLASLRTSQDPCVSASALTDIMNLRQVRKKIRSISNVKKITKAMQLVAAVKMKRAQQFAVEGRPYQESINAMLGKLLPNIDKEFSPLLKKQAEESGRRLIVLFTANKGLCGAFNMNIFRLLLKENLLENADFIAVGKKGALFISSRGSQIIADFSTAVAIDEVSALFQLIKQYFLEGKYSTVHLIYNKFISTLRSEPVNEILLPVTIDVPPQDLQQREREYLIEPSPKQLFEMLLENYLAEKIRSAILNSEAAEHSSRMIAMKNATDNANDVIYNLTLLRNKLRQQKITYELLDMITAKESVESG